MKIVRCFILSIFFALLIPTITAADISVVPVIITFGPADLPRNDIIVNNGGNDDVYVKIVPSIIIAPGTSHEHKEIIRNPEKAGLLVTPQQLIIPANQRRIVRLMLTQPLGKSEKIYRVEIAPVAQNIINKTDLKQGNKVVGIRVLVGYGVLAMVRPSNPTFNVSLSRLHKTLFIHNPGNTNVMLASMEQCIGKKCMTTPVAMRLYAGNTKQISLPWDAPVRADLYFLDEQRTLTCT